MCIGKIWNTSFLLLSKWLTFQHHLAQNRHEYIFLNLFRPVWVWVGRVESNAAEREKEKSYFQTNIRAIFRCYVTNERFKLLQNVCRARQLRWLLYCFRRSFFFFRLIKICHVTRSHVSVMFRINNTEPCVSLERDCEWLARLNEVRRKCYSSIDRNSIVRSLECRTNPNLRWDAQHSVILLIKNN